MFKRRSVEEIHEKVLFLQSLGFSPWHNDSDVSFETSSQEFEGFDFSGTANDAQSIIYTALKHVYTLGLEEGQRNVQQKMREALGIEE